MTKSTVYAAVLLTTIAWGCDGGDARSELEQPAEWWRVHPRPGYASLEKVGTFQNWFDVYELTDGTYAIYEPNQFEEAISYLAVGADRGILIDAGTGIGDIRAVVQALTDLPVSLVLTHEHYDHVGGAFRFDEVALANNPSAIEKLGLGRDNASLQQYITEDYLWKALPEGFDGTTWEIPSVEPTQLLNDGDVINLGGRTIEVLATPGHSPGSVCLLDRANRLLWTGDHFYPGPLYAHASDVNLDDYMASNDRLVRSIGDFDYVLPGHNEPMVGSDVIPRVSAAFDTIFAAGGEYSEDAGLRRYEFDGFGILIHGETVQGRASHEQ
jgi:glyoxylase-like metal-dependent hydrolase (beta-lactamase superfamily II)